MKIQITEDDSTKNVRSSLYNYSFNKKTGLFIRWGKTKEDDPLFAPFSEILDIEVEEKCNGVPNIKGVESPCAFCYKSNSKVGRSMTLGTFKKIIDKTFIGKTSFLTQIAFGADAGAKNNPDLFKMMDYARTNGIIPNITVANIDDYAADNIAKYCGACAVSIYENKNVCYDSVKKLVDRGMTQVNIHAMVSKQTFNNVKETLNDYINDDRLKGMNAIVMLSLKKKGRGVSFDAVSQEEFKELVNFAMVNNIPHGFDSCSCGKYSESIKDKKEYNDLMQMAEPCESTLFSMYINVEGKFYSCSFCENSDSFPEGIDVVNCNDFIKDVWNNEKTKEWRNNLLTKRANGSLTCPVYEV